jgi:hypothetical protein
MADTAKGPPPKKDDRHAGNTTVHLNDKFNCKKNNISTASQGITEENLYRFRPHSVLVTEGVADA